MANVLGARNTGNILQERRVIDMAKQIALLDPNESPFVTFMKVAKRGSRVTTNPKFEWLEDDLLGNSTTLAAAVGSAAVTDISLTDGSIFRPGDILHVPSVGENMLVAIVNGNTVTVKRGYGSTAAATSISVDAVVLKVGNANEENAGKRDIISTKELVQYNYTQIFRTPIGLSKTEMASKLHGGPDHAYQRRKASLEHKRDIANAMYFSQKKEDMTGSAPRRTMGGLVEFIKGNTVAFDPSGVQLTYRNFDVFVAQKAFSHGSKEKLLIAGPNLASAINDWAEKKLITDVDRKATYGIRVKNLITSYGDFKVIYDPLLSGFYAGHGFILDVENIRYAYLQDRDTKLNTNIQANDVDGVVDEFITECSLEVKLPKTHMMITGAYVG